MSSQKDRPENRYPPDDPRHYGSSRFAVRLWHGMTLWAFFRLARGHWHKIPPSRYPLVISILTTAGINSVFALLDMLIYGSRVRKTEIGQGPVLIIGFQRSGTTFLNELMACDPRVAFPDNVQCLQPEAFLVSEKLIRPLARLKPPEKRPMDNVDIAPDAPQEDEIALLLSGVPSPYSLMAFPGDTSEYRRRLEEETLDERKRRAWSRSWMHFLRRVQFANPGKRLLLKSPTHTVRIRRILELFPDAKFVHITRDPYRIYKSNEKLARALTVTQGIIKHAQNEEQAFRELLSGFVRFHEAYERQKPDIPQGGLVTIAYEDLVRDPERVVRHIYEALDLGDFGPVEEPLRAYVREKSGYVTNRYNMDPETVKDINENWEFYFRDYGYEMQPTEQPSATAAPDAAANA